MKRRSQELIVGTFTLLALIAVGLLTVNLRQIGFFTPTYTLHLYFRDASGLVSGAPVTVYGVQAGTVRKMVWGQRSYDGVDYFVDVEVEIAEHIEIFENAQARLVTAGLVGETNISIKAGNPNLRRLGDAGEIYGEAAPTLEEQFDRLPVILDRAERVLAGVEVVVSDADTQRAVKETVENIRSITAHANTIAATADVEVTRLVGDIDGLRKEASAALRRLDGLVKTSEGDVKASLAAFRDQVERLDAAAKPLLDDAQLAAQSTRRAAETLEALIGRPEGDIASTLKNLKAISGHVEAMLAGVRGGRGTVGRLFNDARLYEDLTGTAGSVTDILGVGGEAVFPPIPRDSEPQTAAPSESAGSPAAN